MSEANQRRQDDWVDVVMGVNVQRSRLAMGGTRARRGPAANAPVPPVQQAPAPEPPVPVQVPIELPEQAAPPPSREKLEEVVTAFRPMLLEARGIAIDTPVRQSLSREMEEAVAMTRQAMDRGDMAAALAASKRATIAARRMKLSEQASRAARQDQATRQKAQHDDMIAIALQVDKTYFRPDSAMGAKWMKSEALGSDKNLQDFLSGYELVEKMKATGQSRHAGEAAERVEAAAQAFLGQHPAKDGDSTTDKRARQFCEEGLKAARHYRIALKIQALGVPSEAQPWPEEKQIQANQLRAQIDFETGYQKGSSLKQEGGGGVSESYWIESKPLGAKNAGKTFIFKPVEGSVSSYDEHPVASAAKSHWRPAHRNS